MTNLLIKKFIKNPDPEDMKSRQQYSTLSGSVCIVCNLLLSLFKFLIGTLTHSVSITADAANNLSDAASNTVTIAGAKLASKPVDDEHPFGHGRMEYLTTLVVSFFILIMGFQLGKSSIEKIINPIDVKFSWISILVLILAICVKLWMAYFNNRIYKITNNSVMKAVRQDSLSDCIATSATIAALLITNFTSFKRADGIIGIVVAAIIIAAGIGIVKDIIDPLLGQAPDDNLVKQIEDIMLSKDEIIGVHDLIVHDYGPGRIIASAHAEVPSDINIMEIHDIIDNIEKEIRRKLNIVICIHMDPIVINDERINHYKSLINEIIISYNKNYTFHDFRVVEGPTHTNLIFDLVIPHKHDKPGKEILKEIKSLVKEKDESIYIVATVEHSYI